MSLIRYGNESRSVVLRHQQTLVLYDPQSRQLILREAHSSSPAEAQATGLQTCPFCNRPFHGREPEPSAPDAPAMASRNRSGSPLADSGFVDRHYFRMLGTSVSDNGSSSGPRRRVPDQTRQVPRLKPEDTVESLDEGSSEDGLYHNDEGINRSALTPGYFERFFVTERELGRGGKGVVLLVRHVLDGVSLGHFACKRVPVGDNHEWLKKVLIEVQLLQQLSHQNLVSYRHVWLEDVQLTTFGPKVPCAFILQQYCNHGDLHNYILSSATPTTTSRTEQLKNKLRRKSRGQPEPPESLFKPRKLPFDQIISFFRDIAAGLNHLHSNGFIHRDLKPSNCLLHDTRIPSQGLRVLVSDFGEVQQENQVRKSTGMTGTISYCAPEVLRKGKGTKPTTDCFQADGRPETADGHYGNFTTKSDVFSLGMILHFICFSRLPYAGADAINEENEDLDALREEIKAWKGLDDPSKLRPDLPERLYQSLKTLINPDPVIRPSAEDILVGIELSVNSSSEESVPIRRGSSSSHKSPISPSPLEDPGLVPFRRISPIADTPPPGTPALNGTSSAQHQLHQELSASKRKTSLLSTEPVPMPNSIPPTPTVAPESASSSIILRPPRPITPLNLPPSVMVAAERGIFWKLALFLLKIVVLSQPCAPLAVRPWVYYPLMGLAAVDLPLGWGLVTIVLTTMHFTVVMGLNWGGRLCIY